jgi:hypothetical protein
MLACTHLAGTMTPLNNSLVIGASVGEAVIVGVGEAVGAIFVAAAVFVAIGARVIEGDAVSAITGNVTGKRVTDTVA